MKYKNSYSNSHIIFRSGAYIKLIRESHIYESSIIKDDLVKSDIK